MNSKSTALNTFFNFQISEQDELQDRVLPPLAGALSGPGGQELEKRDYFCLLDTAKENQQLVVLLPHGNTDLYGDPDVGAAICHCSGPAHWTGRIGKGRGRGAWFSLPLSCAGC